MRDVSSVRMATALQGLGQANSFVDRLEAVEQQGPNGTVAATEDTPTADRQPSSSPRLIMHELARSQIDRYKVVGSFGCIAV
jgi:hypothetical protein